MPISTLGLYGLEAGLSGLSSLFGIGAESLRYKQQKKLIDYQFQKNLEMWNKNNEYNSPSAQVQRFQQAGLNPALIYGNGSASAGNSTSVPEYGLPNAPDYSSQIQNLGKGLSLDSMIKARQLQGLGIQNEGMKKDNELKAIQNALKSNELAYSNHTLDSDMKYKIEENKWKLLNLETDYALGRNKVLLSGQEFTLNSQQMMLNRLNMDYITANTKLRGYQAEQASKILSWLDTNMQTAVNEARSRTALNYANSHKINVETDQGKRLFPYVLNSNKFNSLSSEEQYNIIMKYGMAEARKRCMGSDPFSQLANTLSFGMENVFNEYLAPNSDKISDFVDSWGEKFPFSAAGIYRYWPWRDRNKK